MYYLVFTISLAMAAPRVTRNCFTLCDLQKSNPTNAVPPGCNCSLSDLMNAESTSTEMTILDDAGVYFVPAEGDLFQTYFTPQPFLISNPVTGSVAKTDFSEKSSKRIETYERRKSLIRVSNNIESQPPTYLDLEIQDTSSGETSVIQQGNFIPTFESAEQALVECLDLHILDFTRKYGSVENFNEFWDARNLQIYEDLSNADLNDKIKKYCSETEYLIEQSLQDIKRGVPKKKTNFRSVNEDEDDINITNETKESTESEKHDFNNIDKMTESTLRSLSLLELSRNSSPTVAKIDESKSFSINFNKSKNSLAEFTTVTPKNSAKVYDTEFDMDTMPSDIVFQTFKDINKSDLYMVKNKSILEDTARLSMSTTPLSDLDLLFFEDTIGITDKNTENQEERTVPIPTDVLLKVNNELNNDKNEMITNEPTSTSEDTTTIPALTIPLSEDQSLGEIGGNTGRSIAETEELTITKENVDVDKNNDILPASTTPKYKALTLGQISSNSKTSTPKNHGGGKYEENNFDRVTMPSKIILKPSKEIFKSYLNLSGNEPKLNESTIFPTASTSQQNEKLLFGDLNGISAIPMATEPEGKIEHKGFDLHTMPSEVNIKSNYERNMSNVNMATEEPILDISTFIPEPTTPQYEKLSVEGLSRNSETPIAEKESDDNVASNEPIVNETIHFPSASTTPQNEIESEENPNNSTERSVPIQQENHSDRDLDLNTTACNVILNTAGSEPISDETTKLGKPFINIHECISSSDEDATSDPYISTTPITASQPQHPIFKESEVIIPKIITKECQNNEVQSFVTGNEALPNNDFELSGAKTRSQQKKIKQDSSDDHSELKLNSSIEVVNTAGLNDSYISGNLYFGSGQELVPVRLLQTDSGKVSLGIDGHSLCEKLLQQPKNKSLLLSTLCECIHKMPENNSTDVSQ